MSRVCQVTGKRTRFGNSISRRGLPIKKGGIGLKTTGITRRKFRPNLQKVRVLLPDGTVKRIRVAASVIRNGWITITEGGKVKRVPLVKAPRGRGHKKEEVIQVAPPSTEEVVEETQEEAVEETEGDTETEAEEEETEE